MSIDAKPDTITRPEDRSTEPQADADTRPPAKPDPLLAEEEEAAKLGDFA